MDTPQLIPTVPFGSSSDRLMLFFAELPFPAWIQVIDNDSKLVIVATNQKYRLLFGAGQLIWSATDAMEAKDQEAAFFCKHVSFEFTFQSPNEKYWKAMITKYPLVSDIGAIIGFAGYMSECVEIKEADTIT